MSGVRTEERVAGRRQDVATWAVGSHHGAGLIISYKRYGLWRADHCTAAQRTVDVHDPPASELGSSEERGI